MKDLIVILNKLYKKLHPELFFGLKNQKDFLDFGMIRLMGLKNLLQNELKFADLGSVEVDNISNLLSNSSCRPKNLSEFREKKLATLTLNGNEFRHGDNANSMNTHTIGLIINKNPNEYFYKSPEQIIIMDSLGDNNVTLKKVHQALIDDFISKAFPNASIVITKKPQQIDGSLSCLNWTLANLKIAKENMGRVDIINLLPKSSDLHSILNEQEKIYKISDK